MRRHARRNAVAAAVLGVALSLAIVRVAVALLGDVDGDSVVTSVDADQVLQAIVGTRVLTPAQLADADVDGNGVVDVADAQLIRQRAAGLVAGFPTRLPANSGPIALTRDGALVAVVNPDSDSVTFLETGTDTVLAEVAVGREPTGVAFSRDGHRAYVTNARDGNVSVVDAQALAVVGSIPVGVEPFGIVVNFRGDRAYVSNLASSTVSVIDLHSETVASEVAVPAKPQGLAVSADSRTVYVTHLTGGQLSVIDTGTLAVTSVPLAEVPFDELNTTQPAGKPNRMKGITINPARPEAWFPHILSNSGNFVETLFNTTIFPVVGVLDTTTNTQSARLTLFAGLATVVSNPEAVAFAPDGSRAYVVSAASNDLTIVNALTRQEVGLVRDVGDNPRGIVVHPDGTRAWVFNRLTPAVSVVDLTGAGRLLQSVPTSADPLPPNIANGRRLFFTSAPPEVAQDRFFGCEACHFDGRDDGQTWFFTNGPRQTLSLAGTTAHTGLLHHNGDRKDVQDFRFTFTRLQNGTGLTDDQLNDLADFVNTKIRFLENPFLNGDLSRTPAARRGRRTFAAASCATCHSGPFLTDATGHNDPANPLLHDVGIFAVGTGAQDETDKTRDQDGIAAGTVRPAGHFESTFLQGVWATAPYLHDGRAKTLRDVLTTANPTNQHGVTSQLAAAQLDDLVAYLQQVDITQGRVEIATPADGARVALLGSVTGVVLPEVTAVQVFVNGAGPIDATVADGGFTAVVPAGLVPAVARGTHFDVTALATTADGEPGRDDVEVEANFAAAPDLARSTVDAAPALIPSDGVATSRITVTPRDGLGNLAGAGLTIQVATTLGTLGPVEDQGDGTYVAVLTAAATPGVATVSARQAGGAFFADTATVRFASGVVDAAASNVSVSPGSIEASVIARATVTVVPRNALGIDLGPGQTVGVTVDRGTVGPVVDGGEGVYTAVYTPPTTTGVATFRATANATLLATAPTLTLTADRTPPAQVDLGRVTFTTQVGNPRVTGGAGAAEPLSTVRLQNVTTLAAPVNTPAGSDGSFSVNLAVNSNQIVCITAIDAANNASTAACTVPFPVSTPAVNGVLRQARAGSGFVPVAGAVVELDVATITTDATSLDYPVVFSQVFAGGHLLQATTGADGSFQIILPPGFVADPNLAVVTVVDPPTFAMVNDVTRPVTVDAVSSAIVAMIAANDQLLGNPTPFPVTNFTPAERIAIEETLRPATTEDNFFGIAPIDALQPIANDVFFDTARDYLDTVAYETFLMAAESPGTGAPPVVIRGRLTVPAASGATPLANVPVDLATLSFSGCGFPICVAPIAGASGVTNAAGEYSLTLPGFVTPGATTVVVAIGDLTYNGLGAPGPFDATQSLFSVSGFVTDPAVNVDVDLAGRVAMSLIGSAGVPIDNFSPVEMDQFVALIRTRLATRTFTFAGRRLRDILADALNAMGGDAQVVALLATIKGPESGDNSHVTANPTTLQADGVSVSTITVEPLDQTSQRVGPGLLVELSTTLGTITSPALDNHDGTYTAFLRAPITPGTATVTARVQGGMDLSAQPTVTFTPDVTAPAAPDGSRIVFVGVGGNAATVVGLPGAVEAGSQVTVVNTTRGTTVTVQASDDGSFRADIFGRAGDNLTIQDADGSMHTSSLTMIGVNAGLGLPAIANPAAVPAGVTPTLGTLGAAALGAAVPAGFTFVGGFGLGLSDQTAATPLEVLAATAAPVPPGRQLVLVQAIDLPGSTELRVVAPALAAGGVLFPLRDAAYPGVRAGGRYAYLAAAAPQAFLFGVVAGTRGPVEAVHMTLDSSPFTDLTRPDGHYLIAGPLGGGQTAGAALFAHGSPQTVTARLPFAGAKAQCDFTLATRANISWAFTGRFTGLGQVVRRMALTPSGDQLLVDQTQLGDFSILDTASLAQTSLIQDTGTLADLTVTPDGFKAFLAFTNRLRDFTLGIEEPGRVIAGLGTPRRVVVTPDGDLALIASSLDGVEGDLLPDAVFPLDTFSNRVGTPISVDADPAAIAVNRAGTRAYVVSRTRASLGVIDVAGRTVLRTIPLNGTPVDIAVRGDGTQLYVADGTANVVRILDAAAAEDATPGNEVLALVPVGGGPTSVAVTPDGNRLLVTEQQDDTVSVIDLSTRAVVDVWATVDLPPQVLVHPNGKTAYVLDSQSRRGVLEVPIARADTTPPTVVDVAPQDRAGSLLQDSPVEIVFSEKMDAATLTLANVQVRDASGAIVPGTLAVTGEGVAAVFTPAAGVRYALNSTLRVALGAGLHDVAGLALAPVERTVPTFPMQLPDPRLISLDLSTAGVSATGMAGGVQGSSLVEITNLRTGTVFRRTAASDGTFSLPLTGLDSDGYQLVTSLFGGRARTDAIPLHPNFTIRLPDATQVSYQPGPDGTLLAAGAPGAVDPQSSRIRIRNLTSGQNFDTTTVGADGSFTVPIFAATGDRLDLVSTILGAITLDAVPLPSPNLTPPVIDFVTPDRFVFGEPVTLIVAGRNFGTVPANIRLEVGGAVRTDFTLDVVSGDPAEQAISVALPVGTPSGEARVTVGGQASNSVSFFSETPANTSPFAEEVIASTATGDPASALGESDTNFTNLGPGGSITLRLGSTVEDGPGNDFQVFEDTSDGEDCYDVLVSASSVGPFDSLGRFCGTASVNLAGHDPIRFVQLIDANDGGNAAKIGGVFAIRVKLAVSIAIMDLSGHVIASVQRSGLTLAKDIAATPSAADAVLCPKGMTMLSVSVSPPPQGGGGYGGGCSDVISWSVDRGGTIMDPAAAMTTFKADDQGGRSNITVTVTRTGNCTTTGGDTKSVMVDVMKMDSITTSLDSTQNPNDGARPAAGTFTTMNKALDFNPGAADLLVVMKNAGTLKVKADGAVPATAMISWFVEQNPDDIVDIGTPALSSMTGTMIDVTPNIAGNFRLIGYCDADKNGMYDAGEELRVLRMGIIQSTVQPGHFIKTAATFTANMPGPGVSTNNTMNLQIDFLLEGGGADGKIGLDQVTLGNIGNALSDTFVVNYPVPMPAPPPPGNVAGTGTEVIGAAAPAVDSVNVPKGGSASGGSNPFRGNSMSSFLMDGLAAGSIYRVTSLDAPAFGWRSNHPTTMNPWGTTTGANAFREWIVAYTTKFPRNYMALARGEWTVTALGSSTAGVWTDSGSSVTIPGAVMGSAPMVVMGYPLTGDTAVLQALGMSFVSETTLNYAP